MFAPTILQTKASSGWSHPRFIEHDRFGATSVAARTLADLAGHKSGVYLVIDTGRLTSPIDVMSLLDLVATPSAVLYIGSATTLRDRLRALVRSLDGCLRAHGFGGRYRLTAAASAVGQLGLVVFACDPGYCVEDYLLQEHVRLNHRRPMGNLRPARATSRHNRPAWVRTERSMLSATIQVFRHSKVDQGRKS